MRIHRDLTHLPALRQAVITIGTFDGVHSGHRYIIQQLQETAAACDGETVIITFDPHPREVLQPGGPPVKLLTTLDEKIELLSKEGIDHLVIVPFTREFSELSAQAYLEEFLIEQFNPHTIIIGYDHRFGHNREGGLELLEAEQNRYGFRLIEIPQQVVHDLAVSSTKIRKSLQEGNIQLANELLGYPYFVEGTVIHGDKMGRQLGFPTANIAVSDVRKLIPVEGIYAIRVYLDKQSTPLNGVMSIGTRPTFNGADLRVEAHIFDFSEEIYDKVIRVELISYIRANQKFDNIDALVAQMHKDSQEARTVLAS
ncbi:bifunctional riboflavin kinase/FAD synthetase [Chitinophaga pinensis]|uniref:Riboflavin biosynthesis protein n=1 Tax=Chitinophaga pinensis (strain ATCC 43595 / DSM 2588 / LMG 13176 / NBRC 15968 / NCIMB 11800 / UQM 2034) TaxID=485918 RepID=A0A979GAW5_CHIPD|nr:bifunctional riboflavin kinase/FAD synthetase [Chitinophaga pinensis]ACU63927.1 riboflavin biosynthesis protein RibF [Chitinophaga pinensis DSM 2588]